MADDDARKWLSCLGWGCLTVIVLAALAIGGCVAVVYTGGKGAHSAAEAYLGAVDEGRYDDAFALLGDDFTAEHGLDAFVAFESTVRDETGPCEGWVARGTSFNRENGRSTSTLRYDGECRSGPVTAALHLEEIDGSWVIQDIRYNEAPAIPEVATPTCPDCSRVAAPDARFCSFCGARLDGGDDRSQPGQNAGSP